MIEHLFHNTCGELGMFQSAIPILMMVPFLGPRLVAALRRLRRRGPRG